MKKAGRLAGGNGGPARLRLLFTFPKGPVMRKFLPVVAALFVLAGLPAATSFAQAKDAKAPVTTEGLDLGKPVCGPEIKADDLKKPMVVEYWGDRCPPCLAAIPHLCEVQKQYGREKLTVVANQVWTKDADAAKKVWESRAPKEYGVSVVNHGAIKGVTVRAVPRSFVFDKAGKLVWEGHPASPGFDKAVKAAVGE